MDALSLITKNLDVELLLNHYAFDKMRSDGDFIRCCCGIHDGNNPSSFVINRDNGLWFCHTNCGGGDVFTLVQKKEEISFVEAVRWLAKFCNIDIANLEIRERQDDYMHEIQNFIKLMRGRQKKREAQAFQVEGDIKLVARFRNFTSDTLHYFGLGFIDEVTLAKRDGQGTYKLFNRLVIPNFFNGVQHMLSFRSTRASDTPKWSHQPANIETGQYLYNYDIARYNQSIVVTEGIFDVWAYHEIGVTAVCTYGAHLADEQYKLLLKTGADIILSYDNDDAGNKARDKAIEMLKNKTNLFLVTLPKGKDPENITRQELRECYEARTSWRKSNS